MKRARVIIAAGIALVALSGCVPEPVATPTPTSAPTVSPTPSPTTTPTPDPVALVIPECEVIHTLDQMRLAFSPNIEFGEEFDLVEDFTPTAPAAATAAAAAAVQSQGCRWAIPNSDGIVAVTVAEITEAEWAALTAGLLAEGYSESDLDGRTTIEFDADLGVGAGTWTHAYVGGLWVAVETSAYSVTRPLVTQAIASLVAANPGLE